MRRLLAVVAAVGVTFALWGQVFSSGPRDFTFQSDVDDYQQPYALYLPPGAEPGRKFPLIVSLHPEDANHRANLLQLFGPTPGFTNPSMHYGASFPPLPDANYILLCPYARGNMSFRGIAEKDVYDALAEVMRRYPVDENRVYLTGISMGASAALRIALTRPDVWAAVAAVSPFHEPSLDELAQNATNLPVGIFHGELDPVSPASEIRLLHRRLLEAGVPAEYFEYPGGLHNAWNSAYRRNAMFQWFARYTRNLAPERVRLATRSYRYGQAYWLRADRLTTGNLSTIDARVASRQRMEITTGAIDAFTLSGAPIDAGATVVIDTLPVRTNPSAPLSFSRSGGGWRQALAPPLAKRRGLEGPIEQAVAGRQIWVYGSADHPSQEELRDRRFTARMLALWSQVLVPPVSFHPPVKMDTDVTDADLAAADLVLLGTRETNSVIARLAPKLPLHLKPGAVDYGLLYVAPNGNHYALISSGTPWWTPASAGYRTTPRFTPEPYARLTTLSDYVLFRGSLGKVAIEGRFDSNWKLTPTAAAQFQDSGAVTINP